MSETDRGPARLRRMNAARVLDALRTAGAPLPLNDLSERADVSRSSVESLAAELVDLGLVSAEAPEENRGPGRPARSYALRGEAAALVGIDIGAHRTTVLVGALDAVVRGRAERVTGPALGPRARLDSAVDAVREALTEAGMPDSAVRRIHVGTAGIVDRDGIVQRSGAIEGWSSAPIAEALGVVAPAAAVRVDNDVRLAALAEQRTGAATGYADLLHVHLGTRAAAAIVIGGRAHTGHGGAAAEVGFLPAPSLGPAPGPAGPDIAEVADALSRAESGEPAAVARVEEYLAAVVQRIAPLMAAIAPDAVVLGGGLTHSRALIVQPLVDAVTPLLPADVPVLVAAHGDGGAAQGALLDAAAAVSSAQLLDAARAASTTR
ncbi:ROK family protein [Microbacterium sp.]|uniref:ROK family transcriptional regulator n=1 Tax=Microbacterium sp. TaxID=51671 RepID=UPI0033406B3B